MHSPKFIVIALATLASSARLPAQTLRLGVPSSQSVTVPAVSTLTLKQDAGKQLVWSTAAYHDRKPEIMKPPTHPPPTVAPPTHSPSMMAPPTHRPSMKATPTHPPPEHEAHTYLTSSSNLKEPATGRPRPPKPTLGTSYTLPIIWHSTTATTTSRHATFTSSLETHSSGLVLPQPILTPVTTVTLDSTVHMKPELLPTLVDFTTVTFYRTVDTKAAPSPEPFLTMTKPVTVSLLQTSIVWATTTKTSNAVPLYIPESPPASSKAMMTSTVLAKLAHALEDQFTTLTSSIRRKPAHKPTSVKPVSPAKTKSGVLSTSRIATKTTTVSHHRTTTATRHHTSPAFVDVSTLPDFVPRNRTVTITDYNPGRTVRTWTLTAYEYIGTRTEPYITPTIIASVYNGTTTVPEVVFTTVFPKPTSAFIAEADMASAKAKSAHNSHLAPTATAVFEKWVKPSREEIERYCENRCEGLPKPQKCLRACLGRRFFKMPSGKLVPAPWE